MKTDDHSAPSEMPQSTIVNSAKKTGSSEISPVGMLNSLLRRRRMVAMIIVPALIAVIAWTLAQPRSYTSTAAFMPQSRRASSGLSGLAAQLGVGAALGGEGESPAFFADLVKTRDALRAVARSTFDSAATPTLLALYGDADAPPEMREDAALRRLRRDVTATVIQKSGLVRLAARAPRPELAQGINARLLEFVNEFNVQTRRSRATAERQFTAGRLKEVQLDLRRAEDALQHFLQRNRDFRNSPQLLFQQDRLARAVAQHQQLNTTLSEAYEQAKIEEVRDTPVITVVENAEMPIRPDSRNLLRNTLLALVVAGSLALLLAVLRDSSRGASDSEEEDLNEFARLRRDALHDLRHPLRAVLERRDDRS